jgi:hypothetical protein
MKFKKLPYGQSNFADLIERGYAYVDKTRFVELLEDEANTYQICLRPRRCRIKADYFCGRGAACLRNNSNSKPNP